MIKDIRNLEATILATVLYAGEYKDDDLVFVLDPKYFTLPFHKRVATKINEAIADNTLGLCSYILQDKVKGTRYEHDFLEIISATPHVKAKELYELLIEDWFERRAYGHRG